MTNQRYIDALERELQIATRCDPKRVDDIVAELARARGEHPVGKRRRTATKRPAERRG